MLRDELEKVHSREELSRFVGLLAEDLRNNPDEWENTDLYRFLEAMSAWIEDMDGLYRNLHWGPIPEQPTWAVIGQMLLAARIYE